MQKERGMSAVFMASNGKNFVNDLKEQRNLTDNAHKKLAQLIEKNKNLPKITYHNYKKGLESLSKIIQIRNEVDTKNKMQQNKS